MTSLKPFLQGENKGVALIPAAGLVLEKGEQGRLIPSPTPTNAPREPSFSLQASIFITHPYHPHPPRFAGHL